MFSPIFAIRERRFSSSVDEPLDSWSSALTSAGAFSSASLETWRANPWNSSPRATKSVSQLTSTSRALEPERSTATVPSAPPRAAFLSALASPVLRMSSAAASKSPLVSTSAFLHSIMPAPVRSRSCLTVSAVIFIGRCCLTHRASAHYGRLDGAAGHWRDASPRAGYRPYRHRRLRLRRERLPRRPRSAPRSPEPCGVAAASCDRRAAAEQGGGRRQHASSDCLPRRVPRIRPRPPGPPAATPYPPTP